MPIQTPKTILNLNLALWEQSNQPELRQLYNTFFRDNKKFESTYNQFVIYCYHHSTQIRIPSLTQ